jgi:glycosyltransferase involved in cell wall biosynthesis
MKVGVYFSGSPKEGGGAYTFEYEIFQALSRVVTESRHEMLLFYEGGTNREFFVLDEAQGAKIKTQAIIAPLQRFKFIRKVYNRFRHELGISAAPKLSTLDEIARQEKIDMFWSVSFVLPPTDSPYIATVWDIQHRLQPWFPEVSQSGIWHAREGYYSTYLRRACYILTPNVVGQNELSLFYGIPSERFRLLPHPSPLIEYIPDEETVHRLLTKYHLPKGYLFYPAQFWAHKNHANLLLALQILKDNFGQKKHLVLVGSDQGNLEYIRNLTQTLGLEEQVHFLGFVPRDDLIALYHGAFALTYTSLFGPENLPPLEAFRCACPVIISDYNGARQQLGDAALFVNGLNPNAIAQAIWQLECEPELRLTLIERGRQHAGRYTGDDYVRDVFKIFDEFEAVRRNWGNV